MITVRFPNGQAVTYNDARTYTDHGAEVRLYTNDPIKGGTWIATVLKSSGAIIEAVKPCAVTNPILPATTVDAAAEKVERHVRDLPIWRLKDLKRALSRFNAREGVWR